MWNTLSFQVGFDPVIEWFEEQDFGDDIVFIFTSHLTSLADPAFDGFMLTMPDSFRQYLSNFFNVPEDTFGGTHSYRSGRFAVIGREGETAEVLTADWSHEMDSSLNGNLITDLRGAKSGRSLK